MECENDNGYDDVELQELTSENQLKDKREKIENAIRSMVEEDLKVLTFDELDSKYFKFKFAEKEFSDNYFKKYNITIKPSVIEEKKRPTKNYFIRKKPAKVMAGDKEYCSLGTNIWGNTKRLQYEHYKTLVLPDKNYRHFVVKFGTYWKSLTENEKMDLAQSEKLIDNIYD